MSETLFTSYFWKVWNSLQANKQNDNDMPAYFKFLTILCFHVFLGEQVEVAILEVGIGGEFDSTNIVRLEFNSGSILYMIFFFSKGR